MGGLEIGAIVAEPLTRGVQAILALGLGQRGPQLYDQARDFMETLMGEVPGGDGEALAERRLREAVAMAAGFVKTNPVGHGGEVVDQLLAMIGEKVILRAYPSMRGGYLEKFQNALIAYTDQVAERSADWPTFVGEVLGGDRVRILTIHKSKGMEFHTVFVLGVQTDAFGQAQGEKLNLFFVALSRARRRVFFTRARNAGGRQNRLVTLLADADVPGADDPDQ